LSCHCNLPPIVTLLSCIGLSCFIYIIKLTCENLDVYFNELDEIESSVCFVVLCKDVFLIMQECVCFYKVKVLQKMPIKWIIVCIPKQEDEIHEIPFVKFLHQWIMLQCTFYDFTWLRKYATPIFSFHKNLSSTSSRYFPFKFLYFMLDQGEEKVHLKSWEEQYFSYLFITRNGQDLNQ